MKTAAKAHTELQYGRTNLTTRFLIKKYAIQKFFHTTLQNVDFSGLRGGTFASFFSTSRPAREKRFAPSATSVLALPFNQIPSFYELCRRNERGESGTLVSAHLSIGWIVVQPSISPLVHKRKSLKTARKTC